MALFRNITANDLEEFCKRGVIELDWDATICRGSPIPDEATIFLLDICVDNGGIRRVRLITEESKLFLVQQSRPPCELSRDGRLVLCWPLVYQGCLHKCVKL